MIGKSRVANLVPAGCNGAWGHAVGEVFGFTVITLDGNPFTLLQVDAVIQHADDSTTTERVWDSGAGFDAAWAGVGSNWASPVMAMDRIALFVDGDTVRFTVKARDNGGVDSYMSWISGIGNPPGSTDSPALGETIIAPGGKICAITAVEGNPGSVRYVCTPCDHTQAGAIRLAASQARVLGKRENLDSSITASE